jgi:predicted ATPase/class 3 adenylate cyclase
MQSFLFTDIEGSTRLWEEHGQDMAVALARHDLILHTAIDEAGGKVLKTTGDGLIALFDSVPETVSAAVRTQKDLRAEAWSLTGPIRVRMGIHTGDPESRDGDYFGPAMNRAARIMAAGHGGQVLLSGVAAAELEGRLPDGITLRDLGNHRLKDLTLPEHLYQLLHHDLRSDFPPPVTLDARPHNLPQQATEFLGRGDELAAIGVMLEAPSTRLLTIAGPGGAGKTRLGLQVAAEWLDRFRDGVFFVDLSAERQPEAVFEAIVHALDLPMSGTGDALQTLKVRLRDMEMMLVLDNLEQVTAAGTGISELLQQVPGLKVIVTSRETLRVRAEHVFPVPPLSLPHPRDPAERIGESESVQLFVERAKAVRPEFAFGEQNAGVIAEICLRLDGLPLAIELAAARLNVFTAADLLDRLRERLDVLGAGGRDLPDRQRTLWGAIGWSYELLDDPERALFELMSVFSPTGLEAVEAVAGTTFDHPLDLDTLGSLVDKSLIRSEQSGVTQRFSMLLMINEYAAAKLAEDPKREETVRRAHALYFSELAAREQERIGGQERESAISRLAGEIDNLRTAWRYWVDHADLERLLVMIDALWALHESRGAYQTAVDLATDTLAILETRERTPELAAEELVLRSSLARALMAVRGYGPEVEQAFKAALEISEITGTAAQRFPVLRALATYYMSIARFEEGKEYGRKLLELGETEGNHSMLVEGHYVYGVGSAFTGDLETGLPHIDRAIELHDTRAQDLTRFRLGPNTGVVARVASGLILWQCGGLERAITRVGEALEVAREIDHPYSISYALHHNALLALLRGRLEDCIGHARELAEVSELNDYMVWRTLATVTEGVARSGLGETEVGLAMTETGIHLYQGLTAPPVFWPNLLALRGLVHGAAGRPAEGLALIEEAIGIVGPEDTTAAEFETNRGDLLRMLPEPEPDRAETAYRAAARIAGAGGLHLVELQALTRLVDLRREMGRAPDGSEELAAVYGGFTEGLDERDLVAARALLG